MEIIHLILGKANPDRMNGVNRVVNELACRQAAAGQQVQVWGISFNTEHNYPERSYTTRLFQRLRNPFLLHRQLKNAMQQLAGSTVVFHLHGGFVPQMFAAARALRQYCLPYVFTPHGSYNTIAMQRSWLLKKVWFVLAEHSLLRGAQAVHALGKSEIEGLQRIYRNNKSVLIPYGFDLSALMPVATVAHGFTIGYCGRMDIYTKGLAELVHGFNLFYAGHQQARLWIIGDGMEKARLQKMASSLPCCKAITFWGAQYGAAKNSLLGQCNVFAAPSRNEGLPVAVLEAASLGIPCLVTEATNTGDYIREYDAGEVIRHTLAADVYKGLQQLYNRMQQPATVAAFKQQSRQMVAEVFNWNTILSQFKRMYQC